MMVILWDILEQIVPPDILCQLRILKQDIFLLKIYIFSFQLSRNDMNRTEI